MRRWLLRYFYSPREVLYPGYDCIQCVGQEPWQGCHCAYYHAWDPYVSRPPWWARLGRRVWKPEKLSW